MINPLHLARSKALAETMGVDETMVGLATIKIEETEGGRWPKVRAAVKYLLFDCNVNAPLAIRAANLAADQLGLET